MLILRVYNTSQWKRYC